MVYQFPLPTVLCGGQPRPCALDLGFHRVYLDSSSVFMQKIPTSTILADYMWYIAFGPLFHCPAFDFLWYFSFSVLLPVFLFSNLINISLMRPVILPCAGVWTSRTFIRLQLDAIALICSIPNTNVLSHVMKPF